MLTVGMFVADRYEIVEKIGAGGMSDVFKARDHILGRFVAIKILKQEFSEDVNFVTKFRTEAQSAAGLEHPNIVNIYDVGSEDGIYYIVMEYVEGVTLKTYIEKKGQLTYKEAVSIAIQVGRGIEAAHAKHIIHRDIKPQNILISTEGKAKVTDFGIARAVSANTISADVMGSVHYASPEQARNGFVDGKSDIYSLGIVMYEMVTGRVPFDGETTVAVAIQHLQDEMVAPSAYAPSLPVSFEKIILKCTQKSPDRRYGNISDLLIDLKKVLISPNDDFVTMIPTSSQNKTQVIPDEDLSRIKHARAASRYEYEEEDDDYEDEEYDEEGGFLNPKMEKAFTAAGIVAGVIILIVIVYLAGSVMGIFGSGKSGKSNKQSVISTESTKEQVEMVDVTGMTFDDAKAKLNKLSLGIKNAGTQASSLEKGLVAKQDVEAGKKVDINTTITVYLSDGAGASSSSTTDNSSNSSSNSSNASVSVPSVTGMTEADAKNALTAKGLTVSEGTPVQSDTVASGSVISQAPAAGSTAKSGDTVKIVISQGKGNVTVPYVKGMTEDAAKAEIKNAGLPDPDISSENSDSVELGNVISQSVDSGTQVDATTKIKLVISLGPKVTYYSCNATISAPNSDNVLTADIELLDKNNNEIQLWEGIDISSFPYKISVSDIQDSNSGKIKITWYLNDGTTSTQSQDVKFSKQ